MSARFAPQERPNWSGPIASVIRASRRRSRVRDLLAYKIAAFGSGSDWNPRPWYCSLAISRNTHLLIAQIFPFARPNIQIYDAHVVDLYRWVCARYLVGAKGAETKAKRDLSSALDRISEQITTDFQPRGPWRRECQSIPLKDKAFLTFAGQNSPFELRPELGFRRWLTIG